jgi:DNA-binding HxlR family transcriptional regulator
VEYAITKFGKTLIPILEALCTWGAEYLGASQTEAGQCPTKAGKRKK